MTGGISLPRRDDSTRGRPLIDLELPAELRVPMLQHDGRPATVCVDPGQTVARGQLLGKAEHPAALPVLSPADGRVLAIEVVDTARARDVPAVRLRPESGGPIADGAPAAEAACVNDIAAAAEAAGLAGHARPDPGLGNLLRAAAGRGIQDLVINALPGEPMLTTRELLLNGMLEPVLQVAERLHATLATRHVWLAISSADQALARRARRLSLRRPVRVAVLPDRYPQHHPVMLTLSITGREVPPGGVPQDAGTLVLELEAAVALAGALGLTEEPYPAARAVVTVTGPAVRRPGHYRIPVGTSLAEVLRRVGCSRPVVRLVEGGPMTGIAVDDPEVVVTQRTTGILAFDSTGDHVPDPGPCVRCGWCQEDCPVGLDPQRLLDAFERELRQEALRLHAEACLACGLCSYVCPSSLPLAPAAGALRQWVAARRSGR